MVSWACIGQEKFWITIFLYFNLLKSWSESSLVIQLFLGSKVQKRAWFEDDLCMCVIFMRMIRGWILGKSSTHPHILTWRWSSSSAGEDGYCTWFLQEMTHIATNHVQFHPHAWGCFEAEVVWQGVCFSVCVHFWLWACRLLAWVYK